MRTHCRTLRDERGSTLPLAIGLITICLLAVAIVTDVTAVYLQRRNLMVVADAMALAGAQAIDVDAYYANGATRGTRLDPGRVVTAANGYLDRSEARSSIPGLTVEQIATDGQVVCIGLEAPLRLTFFTGLVQNSPNAVVRVESLARLDFRPSA
jgi:hypothetical protein